MVFALTEYEESIFFPHGLSRSLPYSSAIERPAGQTPEGWADRLGELGASVLVSSWRTPSLRAFAQLALCPIKYVCHVTGSVRAIVPRDLLAQGLVVTNWGDQPAALVAEHALLLTLAALRNVRAWSECLHIASRAELEARIGTRTLFGRRVGLHGFGAVARSLVKLLQPFGVEITAYSRGVPPECMAECGVKAAATLSELFSRVDVLVECEALTPATRGCVTREVLSCLPPDAVFVNVGRGAVVDEGALIELAASGRFRTATDVRTSEPIGPNSPWWSVPDALHSPHIAGPTRDRYRDLGAFALANIRRYFAGEKLSAVITPEIYDRST